jgi:isoleucyl-tRNA synthetase
VKRSYDRTGLHDAYLQIVDFESAMSSLYFDALKDPLYSRASGDPRRRSAQSALLYVLTSFLTAIAPVLSFTAEEAWQALPEALRGDAASIFDTSFRTVQGKTEAFEADLALWDELRALRARVAASESPRDFEARLRLEAGKPLFAKLAALRDNLREALVVSQLELDESAGSDGATGVTEFDLRNADGEKCQRCWKFRDLGIDPDHPAICAECAAVISHPRV